MGVYILGKDKKYWNGKHGARPFLIRTNSEDLTRHPHIPSHHISHHHHHPPPMSRPSWIHDMAAMDGKKMSGDLSATRFHTVRECNWYGPTGVLSLIRQKYPTGDLLLPSDWNNLPLIKGQVIYWPVHLTYIWEIFFFLFVIGLLLIHWINKIKVKILKRLECIRGGWSTGPFLSQSIWDGMPNVS